LAHVEDIRAIQATLAPDERTCADRQAAFEVLQEQFQQSDDLTRQHFGHVMASFAPGLFVGGEEADLPQDNLDWNAGFDSPKGTRAAFTATATPGSASSGRPHLAVGPRCAPDAPGAVQRRGCMALSLQPGSCVSAGGYASPQDDAPGSLKEKTPHVAG